MPHIFIFAHGCRLNETFSLGKNILMFKSREDECVVADATSLDTKPSNYTYKVDQIDPVNKPYDYELSFKDDVQEVKFGYECGLSVKNFNDLEVGDNLECYEMKEVKRTLK